MFGHNTASGERLCPWDLTDILKVFALYFLMMGLGAALLVAGASRVAGEDPFAAYGTNNVALALSLLTNGLTCLYIYYIVHVRRGQPVAALGISLADWKTNLTGGMLRYAAILPVIMASGFLVELAARSTGIAPRHQEVVMRFLEENTCFGITAIVVFGTLVGPVAEEVLFRGFLQPALRDMMGSYRAILLTSLIFALVHFNIFIFLQIFILGVLLGYLYDRTGTLIAPMSVHMLHNAVSLCVLFWFKQSGGLL